MPRREKRTKPPRPLLFGQRKAAKSKKLQRPLLFGSECSECDGMQRRSSIDLRAIVTRSRRAAAGRAQLLAKKGASGRMQRLTELVPIVGPSGRLRKAPESCCILEKSRKSLAKIQQNNGNFCEFLSKSAKFSAFFNENVAVLSSKKKIKGKNFKKIARILPNVC